MITVLAGGVGGAKFLWGLAQIMNPEEIVGIINTGDDIKLYGLHISPDLDTITYTLAGRADRIRGWGLEGDTFHCLAALGEMGEATWFRLGDCDLATHLLRTRRLAQGMTLTEVTSQIARSLGVSVRVLPMTNNYVPTWVETTEGEMHFQEYFVHQRTMPRILALRSANVESAQAPPGVLKAVESSEAVILAPSNPFVSIGPILAVPGIREALEEASAPIAAISPIVEGRALKGPAAKMLRELGHEVSAAGVAKIYRSLVDVFIIDHKDFSLKSEITRFGMRVVIADTIMRTLKDRQKLAGRVLDAVLS